VAAGCALPWAVHPQGLWVTPGRSYTGTPGFMRWVLSVGAGFHLMAAEPTATGHRKLCEQFSVYY